MRWTVHDIAQAYKMFIENPLNKDNLFGRSNCSRDVYTKINWKNTVSGNTGGFVGLGKKMGLLNMINNLLVSQSALKSTTKTITDDNDPTLLLVRSLYDPYLVSSFQ
jgi:hypothetical protein